MSVNAKILQLVFGLYLTSVGISPCFAGGYAIPQLSGSATAVANAVVAGTDDPSAVYSNPSALTEVDGNQLLGGLNYINIVSSVKNSGQSSRNIHDDNFVPTLFANYHVPDTNLTLGVGSYTPFGLATSYAEDAFTRFAAIRAELKPVYITTSAAWRITQQVSIGGGMSFVRSSALLSRAIFLGGPEGRVRLTDTDQSYGFNLGLLWKPTETVKFGLTYRSHVDLDFDTAVAKFRDTTGSEGRSRVHGLKVPLPAIVAFGVQWRFYPQWAIEFDYNYTRWNVFRTLKGRFASPLPALGGLVPISSFVIPQDWKDSSTLRLGLSYKATQELELRAGIALDETPVPGQTLNPAIPGADILGIATGLRYQWKMFALDVGYLALFYKTRRVHSDVLEGAPSGGPAPQFPGAPGADTYKTFNNFVSVHLRYRF